MATTALAAGVYHERWQAFLGQRLHTGYGGGFFAQQLDLVERDAKVGIDALFGGRQVAAGVDLVAGDGLLVFAFTAQQHHTGRYDDDQQADQQHIEGFVPRAGGAHHVGAAQGRAAHGCAMSA
ncbi:hypothetical protein D3C81_1671790 [compost metagenome]